MKIRLLILVLSCLLGNAACTKLATSTNETEGEGTVEETITSIDTEDKETQYTTSLEWAGPERTPADDINNNRTRLLLTYSPALSYQVLLDSLTSTKGIPYKDLLVSRIPTKDTIFTNRERKVEVRYHIDDQSDSFFIHLNYKNDKEFCNEYVGFEKTEEGTNIDRSIWVSEKPDYDIPQMNAKTVSTKEWSKTEGDVEMGIYSYMLLPTELDKSYEKLYQVLQNEKDGDAMQMLAKLPTKDTVCTSRGEEYGNVSTIYRLEDKKISIEIEYEGGVTEYILEQYDATHTKATRILYPD